MKIVIFDKGNGTVSDPIDVTRKELEKLEFYFEDSDYTYTRVEDHKMSPEDVEEIKRAADEFWKGCEGV